jgi:hypothetical protein
MEKRKFFILLGLEFWPLCHPAHSQSLYNTPFVTTGPAELYINLALPRVLTKGWKKERLILRVLTVPS